MFLFIVVATVCIVDDVFECLYMNKKNGNGEKGVSIFL
jgi:hypothetical protein